MAVQLQPNSATRRMAVYSYLRPVLAGQRILEVGCETGESAAYLTKLGARSVITAGSSSQVLEARKRYHEGALGFVTLADGRLDASGPFDMILLPDAEPVLRGLVGPHLAVLRSLLAPEGRFACIVENGDQGEGLGYYELLDLLTPFFSKVRMFGQTPFMGIGVAEFDENAVDLRVESDLIANEQETPSHYIALAGPDVPINLGYALVQIPHSTQDLHYASSPSSGSKAPESALMELRQRLAEAEGKAEGLVRVSRAQIEEIEELRARVRRTSEARAELDEEVRRLRRSLVEADESVVSLSRKTAQEITALAQRLTSGLRVDETVRATDEVKRFETLLAERESTLVERDDRIAQLELSRQEAEWRLSAAEDELSRARSKLLAEEKEKNEALANWQRQLDEVRQTAREDAEALRATRVRLEEQTELTRQRERSIDDFKKAAALHLEELGRLRDASHEQASRVTELEDELTESNRRLTAAMAEAEQARKALAEMEESDRHRRARLAELEGRMLRVEYTEAARAEAAAEEEKSRTVLESQVQALKSQLSFFQSLVPEVEQLRTELNIAKGKSAEAIDSATARIVSDQEQLISELQAKVARFEEKEHRIAELRAEIPDPEEAYDRLYDREMQYQAAAMAAARVPVLEARIAELEKIIAQRD